MRSRIKLTKEQKWRSMWYKYAEFLRANGRAPFTYNSKERDLYSWFKYYLDRYNNDKLDEPYRDSFANFLDGGNVYKFYVTDRRASLWLLENPGKRIVSGKPAINSNPDFGYACELYKDFCVRMNRHPWSRKNEERALATWYKAAKDDFFNNRLTDKDSNAFSELLQSVSAYMNYNNPEEEAKRAERERIEEAFANGAVYETVRKRNHKPHSKDNEADKSSRIATQGRDYHLYDYQADMKHRIEDAFLKFNSVMAQMPTGTGKTHVVASVVRDFVHDGMGEVWIVAHRRELVAQIKHTLGIYLSEDEMSHIRATSIQWLSNHYKELDEEPGLIVVDEAHHAIAKTYANVLETYDYAKKLGVTATPYRLSGAGFKDLFQTLLTSWEIKTFIRKGYLCAFDYYCIGRRSVEKFKVDGLRKRGADGDYQPKELDESFNQREIIARLFESYQKFAKGKRGFVYAININHAENIARYYREHAVSAVAVSSKTPDGERAKDIDDFRNGKTAVLCSVDLFSEGFDAPDAEFIQLARPTLSLAKYLQMVGRGLRTAKGKNACIILDNVGLKDRFGLPSKERNWEYYFNGEWRTGKRRKGRGDSDAGLVMSILGEYIGPDNTEDMTLEASHDEIRNEADFLNGFKIVSARNGLKGINEADDRPVLRCLYDHIAINENGIAAVKKGDVTKWFDLHNGLWYDNLPDVGYVGSIPMAYADKKFYPRISSKWITDKNFIPITTMRMQFGNGLDWNNRFINWDGKPKVYKIVDAYPDGVRILRDDNDKRYVQRNPKDKIVSMGYIKDLGKWLEKRQSEYDAFKEEAMRFPREYDETDIEKLKARNLRVWKDSYGIITVTQNDGSQYWIDSISHRIFHRRPTAYDRGNVRLLRINDFVFIRNSKKHPIPYQDWQILSDGTSMYIRD